MCYLTSNSTPRTYRYTLITIHSHTRTTNIHIDTRTHREKIDMRSLQHTVDTQTPQAIKLKQY